jgi:two-component system sensor histidine kinase ComP
LEQISSDSSVSENLREQLFQITQGLLDVIYQIRITCNELRPPMLKEEGIVTSLEALFEMTQLRTDYSIEFVSSGFRHTLDDDLLIGLYRIVQELLANAAKHSNAALVKIILTSYSDHFLLNYEDNGVGMDFTGRQNYYDSMGIHGMKERVRSMEGKIEFFSSRGNGLSIFITVPSQLIEPQ